MGSLIALPDNMHRAYVFADDRGFHADLQPKQGQTLFTYSTEKERDFRVRKWLRRGEYRNPRRAISEYFGVTFQKSSYKKDLTLYYTRFSIPYYGFGYWVVFYDQKPTIKAEVELQYGPWTFCMLKY